MTAEATPSTIIQAPPDPTTDDVLITTTQPFHTTLNGTDMTTEASLLDGFDAITITGVIIGGGLMLACILLPLMWLCSNSRKRSRSRKESTTSGRVYSSSGQRRKSSLSANVYSESGYKSESDFKSESRDFTSENSAFKSEAPNMEYKVVSEKSSSAVDAEPNDDEESSPSDGLDSQDKTEQANKENDEGIHDNEEEGEDESTQNGDGAGDSTWL